MPTPKSNRNMSNLKEANVKATKELAHFFAPVDRGSSMPSWYYKAQMEEQQQYIKRAERELEEGLIAPEDAKRVEFELKRRKKRQNEIENAYEKCKKLVEKDKDKFIKKYNELKEAIAESLDTRDHMWHMENGRRARVVNPRDEAERTPIRNNPIKYFKVLGHLLGESTNVEALRK